MRRCAAAGRAPAINSAARQLCLRAHSQLHSARHALPADVDVETGRCAGGRVCIADAPGKGLGAFAAHPLPYGLELGRYRGEMLLLEGMHARYSSDPPGDAAWHGTFYEWQHEWRQERERRGVTCTGRYVFKFGTHPKTGRLLMIDAEDPEHANWTRFLNHSRDGANLEVRKSVAHDEAPAITFVTSRGIEAGEELLFDYGPAYFDGELELQG